MNASQMDSIYHSYSPIRQSPSFYFIAKPTLYSSISLWSSSHFSYTFRIYTTIPHSSRVGSAPSGPISSSVTSLLHPGFHIMNIMNSSSNSKCECLFQCRRRIRVSHNTLSINNFSLPCSKRYHEKKGFKKDSLVAHITRELKLDRDKTYGIKESIWKGKSKQPEVAHSQTRVLWDETSSSLVRAIIYYGLERSVVIGVSWVPFFS